MTTKVMVSFPDEFLDEVDRIANQELRSRSELIREALRYYMGARQRAVRPGDRPHVQSAVESINALARVTPGSGEDSAEDVRYWRETRQ
ncbi:MAG TPA: ribbon-helix-helix protein, CopG family [Chloroflexi bacterium]|nr:ribbon-helix-helix protein, CopG family [Chloroflexota bacterium]